MSLHRRDLLLVSNSSEYDITLSCVFKPLSSNSSECEVAGSSKGLEENLSENDFGPLQHQESSRDSVVSWKDVSAAFDKICFS